MGTRPCVAGLYAAFTPFVDTLANLLEGGTSTSSSGGLTGLSAMAVFGACLCALGHMCFGPSPLLGIPERALRGWRVWALEAAGGKGWRPFTLSFHCFDAEPRVKKPQKRSCFCYNHWRQTLIPLLAVNDLKIKQDE